MMRIWIICHLLLTSFLFAKEKKIPVFSHAKELEVAQRVAREAGIILLQYWNQGIDLEIEMKGDVPVTIAHYESSRWISKRLLLDFPDYGLLIDENLVNGTVEQATLHSREIEWTWVVDPLDGTKSYIAGRRDFGVHIALLHFGIPVVGVNYYPVSKAMYFGVDKCGAYKQVKKQALERIFAEKKAQAVLPIISSRKSPFIRSFYSDLLGVSITSKMLRKDFKVVDSSGLGICLIAEGKRNIYVSDKEHRSLWNYASSAVILQEAGGWVGDVQGEGLDFLFPDLASTSEILFCGSKDLFEKGLKSLGSRGVK